jgi:hypothetical protein
MVDESTAKLIAPRRKYKRPVDSFIYRYNFIELTG